jgi:hypothetical protein
MSNQGPVLARVLGQQPRRPDLVRIAELLGLAASKIDQPSPASTVITGSRPGRALSSSAASAPCAIARSTQRCTV